MASDVFDAIRKLREEGELANMEKSWWRSQSSLVPDNAISNTPNSLGLGDFGGLFFISLVSFILALILHLIFILQKKMQFNNIIVKLLSGGKLAFMLRLLAARRENMGEPVYEENGEQGLTGSSLGQARSSH